MLKDHSLGASAPKTGVDALLSQLDGLSDAELVELRHAVDARLVLDLGELDLAKELALQYTQGKSLLSEVQGDRDTPANQKAQIFSAVRNQLSDIIKQQDMVWGMQRLKAYEAAFLKAARLLTSEAKIAFFDLYKEQLGPEARGQVRTALDLPKDSNAA
jgi:hypothetical protein